MAGTTRRIRHVARIVAAVVAAALICATGACSSPIGLPTGGGVQTLSPVEQQTQRVYTSPEGPTDDAQPESIVEGFFNAMPAGVQSDGYRVARQFLTAQAVDAAGLKGKVKIITIDGTKNALQALVDGDLSYVIEYNPIFGKETAQAVKDYLDGKDVKSDIQIESKTFDATSAKEALDSNSRAY
ncbi:sugar ABC transporter substrate-binding protein [Bifidobacterium stellenboschense]|uniref:Sugar ABC transporter substrate-binding protein n=1 Tax=Bifidobacterium stellenboschense TaxID=762211 RepID=A0A087DQU5_9BIFI|nr:sugar ABC transporter substrate-binding protein [Bifidobacterium stellenboschense]